MTKVLVVDNSKSVLTIFTELLSKKGYEVVTADDGLTALTTITSFRPDVMFVDLVMPIISGDKLCRAVREMPQFDEMPLVIISGIAAEEKIDFFGFRSERIKNTNRYRIHHRGFNRQSLQN